jgi:hypothetical protein
MWYLKDKVSEREYKNSWCIFFISAPFLGGIFGAILYLIIIAGILSLGVGENSSQGFPDIDRPAVIVPIAALAVLIGNGQSKYLDESVISLCLLINRNDDTIPNSYIVHDNT